MPLRTLFLHPPSWEGFDGGAGSRYQARREVRSYWYPTWLAQPAALVPGSRLVDAPPDDLTLDDVRPLAREYELAVLHTSTPSFPNDVKVAEALKAENPRLCVGLVGAHVAVHPEASLRASSAIDFVARTEFDFTIKEVAEGRPLARGPRAELPRERRRPAHAGAPRPREHGRAAVRRRRVQAGSDARALLHRLSAASLRVALHRTRLSLEVHLLPVAADGRRPALSHAVRRSRRRGDRARPSPLSPGEGVLLRRRHLHRRPAARRGHRERTRAGWA